MELKRGDVVLVNLGNSAVGSEQGGDERPAVILQNNVGNKFSPTVIVAFMTSQIVKAKLPTHVVLSTESGVLKPSVVMLEQQRTIDKKRIVKVLCKVSEEKMLLIDEAIKISLALKNIERREEKIAREKAQSVKELDNFISMWISKSKPLEAIYDFVEERMVKIKDLERFCFEYRLDMKKYYDLVHIQQGAIKSKMAV